MRPLRPIAFLLAALVAVPALAQGAAALTARPAHLRAGPARDYPVVAVLPPQFPVAVQGCLSDYSWCDVVAGASRGWLYAGNISYAYRGGYAPLVEIAPAVGIGIVGFALGDYWSDHYRGRPWFRDRDHWAQRGPPPHWVRGGPPHRPYGGQPGWDHRRRIPDPPGRWHGSGGERHRAEGRR